MKDLKKKISNLVKKKIELTNVIYVMLHCRLLLYQRRPVPMCDFNMEYLDSALGTVQNFFRMTRMKLWKVLFKTGEVPPPTSEDRGLSVKRRANPVSYFMFCKAYLSPAYLWEEPRALCQSFRPG